MGFVVQHRLVASRIPGWGGQPVFMLRSHCGKSELDTWRRSLLPAATRAETGPTSIRYSWDSPGRTGLGSDADSLNAARSTPS
jgi:hypothetical protein